jgi:preprotein translocase subunit SecE
MAADVVQTTSGNRVTTYFNDVVAEMRKVTWPDRAQLKDTTFKIIVFVLLLGAVIGLIDVILQAVLVRGLPSLFTGSGR